jgi:hypothetical protein
MGRKRTVRYGWKADIGSRSFATMREKIIGLLSLAVLISVSCSRRSDERQVSDRFERYMAAWERNDRQAVWDFMSERMQRGNDNSVASFEDDRETPELRVSRHTTKSIKVAGDQATIEADVRFSDASGKPLGTELERFQFIREKGRWVFDDYKPVTPP